jgi:hypothetical protein
LRSIASLQRTESTPPLVDFSRALPLDLFEQLAVGFVQQCVGILQRAYWLMPVASSN